MPGAVSGRRVKNRKSKNVRRRPELVKTPRPPRQHKARAKEAAAHDVPSFTAAKSLVLDDDIYVEQRSYKRVYAKTFSIFANTLDTSNDLLDLLMKDCVLDTHMKLMVQCAPNRPRRAEQLIELLMDLGPASLNKFIVALRLTKQDAIANILAAERDLIL